MVKIVKWPSNDFGSKRKFTISLYSSNGSKRTKTYTPSTSLILYFSLFMKYKNCNEQLRVTPKGEKTSPTWEYSDARRRWLRKHIFRKEKKMRAQRTKHESSKNKKYDFFHFFGAPWILCIYYFSWKVCRVSFSFFFLRGQPFL